MTPDHKAAMKVAQSDTSGFGFGPGTAQWNLSHAYIEAVTTLAAVMEWYGVRRPHPYSDELRAFKELEDKASAITRATEKGDWR